MTRWVGTGPPSTLLLKRQVEVTMQGSPSDKAESYVAAARDLELLALELAQQNTEEKTATRALIEAAGGDIRVMRRAHRHCEFAMSDQWPAGRTLIRAFDYLSSGRQELETGTYAAETSTHPSASSDAAYDVVEEAGIGSFPASDAPSFWGR